MSKRISVILKFVLCLMLLSCLFACGNEGGRQSESTDTGVPVSPVNMITIASCAEGSDFVIVRPADDPALNDDALFLRDRLSEQLGAALAIQDDTTPENAGKAEIIIGAADRPEYAEAADSLKKGEYRIRLSQSDDAVRLIIAYNGNRARHYALDRLVKEYLTEDRFALPEDTDIHDVCVERDVLINTGINLRDPFVLLDDDGTYYLYGTGWKHCRNKKADLFDGWLGPLSTNIVIPEDAAKNYWAPEVHRYHDAYYMFTTYFSSKTNHRGCAIFRSETPEGPFVEITNGTVTPADWDCIDGTLYIDGDGQPWMVFVHEWTSMPDGNGRMAAARLSDDLTSFISEPIDLFGARDGSWAQSGVTDGPFLYTTSKGDLLMLWSNWDYAGYCVAIARSDNGKIDGNWTVDDARLYSGEMAGKDDGGHGMIFTDTDGQMYLVIHSPNSGNEKDLLIPIRETGHTLVWDMYRK